MRRDSISSYGFAARCRPPDASGYLALIVYAPVAPGVPFASTRTTYDVVPEPALTVNPFVLPAPIEIGFPETPFVISVAFSGESADLIRICTEPDAVELNLKWSTSVAGQISAFTSTASGNAYAVATVSFGSVGSTHVGAVVMSAFEMTTNCVGPCGMYVSVTFTWYVHAGAPLIFTSSVLSVLLTPCVAFAPGCVASRTYGSVVEASGPMTFRSRSFTSVFAATSSVPIGRTSGSNHDSTTRMSCDDVIVIG